MWRCVLLGIGLAAGTACGFLPAGPDDVGECDTGCDAPGPLQEEAFLEAFVETFCEAWVGCGSDAMGDCPVTVEELARDAEPCAFDPEMASDCLDGAYPCVEATGTYTYPDPPSACDLVYEC